MLIGIDGNEANITHRVGVNQYAFGLLHALSLVKSNHKFIIYLKAPALPDMPPEAAGWQYRIIPFPKLWTQIRLPWDLYTHKPRPDVFFSPSHYAPRWSPVPTVISIMDLGFLQSPGQFTAKDFNQLKNWTAYSAGHAAKIIAISEYHQKGCSDNLSSTARGCNRYLPGLRSGSFQTLTGHKSFKAFADYPTISLISGQSQAQ